jgi:xylulokinase
VVEGKAFTTIGTSGVVFAHSDKVQIDPKGRVHTFCAAVPGAYTVMSCTLAAGLSLKWYRDTFCQAEIDAAKEMDTDPYILMNQQAAKSPIGANRLIFLPYLMGERSPINDTGAQGLFIGLRPDTSRADMYQAVLEGVAFAIKDNLEIIKQFGVDVKSSCLCGGGAKSALWRTILANVLGVELILPLTEQGPGYGAAILAMVGAGQFDSVQTASKTFFAAKATVSPDEHLVALYKERYEKYRRIYPAVKELYKNLK